MKLLMFIVDEEKKEELEVLLNRAGVTGYTEMPHAVGTGRSGPRLGSRAFPKTSALIFTVLEPAEVGPLVETIRGWCTSCGEQLRIVAWGVEQIL
jgi:hypothetical protein